MPEVAKRSIFTVEELAKHNQPNDLWIAVGGKVYDITRYRDIHPGGVQILRDVGGTDATAAFHDVGHSDDAIETLQTFMIGDLKQYKEVRIRPTFTSRVILPAAMNRGQRMQIYTTIARAAAQKTFILACILVAAKLLWPELVTVSAVSRAISAVSSFWKGVVLSSAASTACFWIVGSEVSKSLEVAGDLRRYPPIMKPTKALRGPPKIAGLKASVLDPRSFQPLALTERIQLTPNTYKFILSNPDTRRTLFSLPPGRHVQVRAETVSGSVTRSYTPTLVDTQNGHVELTIKVYAGSKMGTHLLHLPIGSPVEVRGPVGNFKDYHRFLCADLAMIAGGTGITPMWQLIKSICADPSDDTRITLLYANRTQRDILLRQEIDALAAAHPAKLSVHYFVSADDDPSWTGDRRRITADRMARLLPAATKSSKYLVCGPDAMVDQITKDLTSLGCDSPKTFKHATDQVFIF